MSFLEAAEEKAAQSPEPPNLEIDPALTAHMAKMRAATRNDEIIIDKEYKNQVNIETVTYSKLLNENQQELKQIIDKLYILNVSEKTPSEKKESIIKIIDELDELDKHFNVSICKFNAVRAKINVLL